MLAFNHQEVHGCLSVPQSFQRKSTTVELFILACARQFWPDNYLPPPPSRRAVSETCSSLGASLSNCLLARRLFSSLHAQIEAKAQAFAITCDAITCDDLYHARSSCADVREQAPRRLVVEGCAGGVGAGLRACGHLLDRTAALALDGDTWADRALVVDAHAA
eukprot:6179657-Pleurochrysis_carterae.AAC.2